MSKEEEKPFRPRFLDGLLGNRSWPDRWEHEVAMSAVIYSQLARGGKQYYQELTDEEVLAYGHAIYAIYEQLRDEWSSREFARAMAARQEEKLK